MSQKQFILALDQGTTGSTALLLDTRGQVVARGYQTIPTFYPQPGWVEQSPLDIFDRTVLAAKEAITQGNITAQEIAGIGITNQRETTVLWNKKTLAPVGNAIIWQCKRTLEVCEKMIRDGYAPEVLEKTGLTIDPYFSATKINWILQHHEQAKKLLAENNLAFGTIDSWLIAKLTSGRSHLTDVTNASRTLCFNIHTQKWDAELLKIFGVPSEILPAVQHSRSDFGEIDSTVLGSAIPILSVMGDQQSSLYGHGGINPGDTKCTFGTGAFALSLAEKNTQAQKGILTTLACDQTGNPVLAFEGSIFIAGAAVQWLRDNFGIIATAKETELLALSTHDEHGIVFVPTFSGLGTPHWNPKVRGTLFGMTRGTNRSHIVRATLEAIAYQTFELLLGLEGSLDKTIPSLKIDGGMSENRFFTQYLADILQIPVEVSEHSDLTAYGTAKLCSTHPHLKDLFSFEPKKNHIVNPRMPVGQRNLLMEKWKHAVSCAIHYASLEL